MKSKFVNTVKHKAFFSENFKYTFDKNTGQTITWGQTYDDDPESAPFNMILDFEITERCFGIGTKFGCMNSRALLENIQLPESNVCKFCYKSNTPYSGYVTPFEEAKTIIDKLPIQCTQIAFGVDATLSTNPDWYKIFEYAREKTFIPNVTVADLNEDTAEKVASIVGAVAVSRYSNKNICYDTIESLSRHGAKYVNMHIMLSKETLKDVLETIDDIPTDKRLKHLYAVVFLSLKRKGRGESFHSISQEEFSDLIRRCNEKHIRFGFDSCSAHKFLSAIKGTENEKLNIYCEPCESSLFSAYINARGEYFPCSFTEGTPGWETGLDVLHCNDFITDIWNNPKTLLFREKLLMNNRHCPIYNI